ncbi:hypothetical protein OK016_27730 [Vibrio chagasii]|nr:hypothetical protein [Vibrio chagasii]
MQQVVISCLPKITEKRDQRLIATHWGDNIRQLGQYAALRVLTQWKQTSTRRSRVSKADNPEQADDGSLDVKY